MDQITKGIEVIEQFRDVMHTLKRYVESQCKKGDLTAPQGMLIGLLESKGNMKISQLSERLGLSNSTVSGMVDRLEKRGIVARKRSDSDRRIVYVELTPEFEENAHTFMKSMEKKLASVMGRATDEDLNKALEGLKIIENLLNKTEAGE